MLGFDILLHSFNIHMEYSSKPSGCNLIFMIFWVLHQVCMIFIYTFFQFKHAHVCTWKWDINMHCFNPIPYVCVSWTKLIFFLNNNYKQCYEICAIELTIYIYITIPMIKDIYKKMHAKPWRKQRRCKIRENIDDITSIQHIHGLQADILPMDQ